MIDLVSVSKIYNIGDTYEKTALDQINIKIEKGEWYNILGPNGSGKSTLLKIISGEIAATHGILYYNDIDITRSPQEKRAKNFQYIEQNADLNLVLSMTIEEFLCLAFNSLKFPGISFALTKKRRNIIFKILKDFNLGLENRLSSQIRFLSEGEKQAIIISKILISRVEVLLLDEFLSSLDPHIAPILLEIIKTVAKNHRITVLMVSHDIDHVIKCGGNIVFLQKGKITEMVSSNTPYNKDKILRMYKTTYIDSD